MVLWKQISEFPSRIITGTKTQKSSFTDGARALARYNALIALNGEAA